MVKTHNFNSDNDNLSTLSNINFCKRVVEIVIVNLYVEICTIRFGETF